MGCKIISYSNHKKLALIELFAPGPSELKSVRGITHFACSIGSWRRGRLWQKAVILWWSHSYTSTNNSLYAMGTLENRVSPIRNRNCNNDINCNVQSISTCLVRYTMKTFVSKDRSILNFATFRGLCTHLNHTSFYVNITMTAWNSCSW